jgi:hypothetical protein
MLSRKRPFFKDRLGIVRADSTIGLMNLTYNLNRYVQLQKVGYKG